MSRAIILATLALTLTGGAASRAAEKPQPPASAILENAPRGTVYVVFLAPGLGSTLGPRATDKDYVAYHNHVHSAAGVIHYAVVPYDGDLSRWVSAARQSLHQTLINPEGNGWY